MRYFAPAQLQESGRWDFTMRHDKHITPVGYCRDAMLSTKEVGHHATKAEAIECYRKWLMSQADFNRMLSMGNERRCAVCGDLSLGFVSMPDMFYVNLCHKHRTKEDLNDVFEFTGFFQIS